MSFLKTYGIVLTIVTSMSQPSFSKSFPCTAIRSLPYLMDGCEGEECDTQKYDKAINDADVYIKPSIASKKLGVLKKCDKIVNFKAKTMIERFGKAKIVEDSLDLNKLNLKIGDEVYLLKHQSEGIYLACKNDVIFFIENFKELQPPITKPWSAINFFGNVGFIAKKDYYLKYADGCPKNPCRDDHPFGRNYEDVERDLEKRFSFAFDTLCPAFKGKENNSLLKEAVWKQIFPYFPKSAASPDFFIGDSPCTNNWKSSMAFSSHNTCVEYVIKCLSISGKFKCKI